MSEKVEFTENIPITVLIEFTFSKNDLTEFLFTNTVWKFLDFSVTQILRETSFVKSRRFKTATFCHFTALNLVN